MKASAPSALLISSWLSVTALARGPAVHDSSFVPDHVLRVTYENISTACETRLSVVVNGTAPGPTLHILPGSVTWIRVYNDMEYFNLTMHWHGLAQRMAPFADGTPLASQWPIPPGHFFDYELATEEDDSGTYYYHSHVGMQALTSAGPLIVDDCDAPLYNYDGERILQFEDYFPQLEEELVKSVAGVPFQWPGNANAILLNGYGIASGREKQAKGLARAGRCQGRTRVGDTTYAAESSCGLAVIDVDPGKTYRFRFIGALGLSLVTLGIEGHSDLTIIQVDGAEYNAPVNTDHLQFGPGQRFDVLFKTKTQSELGADGNKPTYFFQFETRDAEAPGMVRGYAVLRYNPDAAVPPPPAEPVLTLPEEVSNWMEYTFQPLFPEKSAAPTAEEVTRRIIIDVNFVRDNATSKLVWELAHLSWTEHSYSTPALVDIYMHGAEAVPNYEAAMANWGWDPATRSFPVKMGEVLEIILLNRGVEVADSGRLGSHPFHAHSKHYYDIGGGPGDYDADANNAKMKQMNYKPIRRDTTMLYRYGGQAVPGQVGGWRGWRIRNMDAGVWMVHCHILPHMMMGMQMVWVVGDEKDLITIPFEESMAYMTYGGSVMGNMTHDPQMYEYFDASEQKCRPIEGKKV